MIYTNVKKTESTSVDEAVTSITKIISKAYLCVCVCVCVCIDHSATASFLWIVLSKHIVHNK
jgi:hypothetical protein